MIEILTAGALATVQDLGRHGALGWGVGVSGAMDTLALAAGNILLGNNENDAAIEVPVFPFRARFRQGVRFAVTGANVAVRLDGRKFLPWWTCEAAEGQVLELGAPGPSAWKASRAYLCVSGGIAAPLVLGSRSTQLRGAFGGHHGRALRDGDAVPLGAQRETAPNTDFGLLPPGLALPLAVDGVASVRVLPAAEYDAFTESSREVFWADPWKITTQSDRYGYRLAGTALEPLRPLELRSHGIVPGVIQVPHGGQPIIQMRDAQPSGGYPKIGTVIEADLWRLGQAPIGSHIRFQRTTWDEAIDALDETRRWLDTALRFADLRRLQGVHR
jgi:5-oxoprolinase (ATP-hydrolysing) subunit C